MWVSLLFYLFASDSFQRRIESDVQAWCMNFDSMDNMKCFVFVLASNTGYSTDKITEFCICLRNILLMI